MKFHCVGCGNSIPWDGTGLFSYTCRCGGNIFVSEDDRPSFPASVLIQMCKKKPVTHLDDIIGVSDYTSPEKDGFIAILQGRGFTWMEECEQCKTDGTLKRYQQRHDLDRRQAHISERLRLDELTIEEAIEEHVAASKQVFSEEAKT